VPQAGRGEVSAATENRRNHDREVGMNLGRRAFLLSVTLAAAGPAFGQQAAPTTGLASVGAQGAASIPDFSGIWRHGSLPWFEPPESGPAPVTNRSRKNGVSNYDQLVGDYTNPILKPWAAEVVKKYGEISLAGVTFPSPSNQCWPEPVPFTTPWTATITYALDPAEWPEVVCAENRHEYYSNKDSEVPTADKPDF
jgi:hypothetical protein